MMFRSVVVTFARSAAVAGAGLILVPALATPAGAAAPPVLEGGATGIASNITLGTVPINLSNPAVVTPPGGGSVDGNLGQVSVGGLPPLVPPLLSVALSLVHTDGTVAGPRVNSSASLLTLQIPPLGINLSALSSTCTVDDGPGGAVTAGAGAGGTVGSTAVGGPIAKNMTIAVPLGLTLVLNEQVPGVSSDGHPGILVNAAHLYVGAPGPTYSSQGLVLAQSRCEVAPVPIPPGIVPEVPLPLVLPLSAAGAGGLGLVAVRRRHSRRLAV